LFADNSWYFRNALVRANYNDYKNKIYSTFEYLNRFFGNLLLGEKNPLRNRDLRVLSERGANVPVKAENVPVNVPVKRKDEILRMLQADPNMTAGELAAVFSVTAKTIKRDFSALKNEGKIKRVGSDKTGRWEITR